MVFFNFFYIKLSQSDDLVQGYCRLTQVDSPLITQVTCLSRLLELTLALFLSLFYSILYFQGFFSSYYDPFNYKKICFFLLSLPFYHLIKSRINLLNPIRPVNQKNQGICFLNFFKMHLWFLDHRCLFSFFILILVFILFGAFF